MFIDSHAHLNFKEFEDKIPQTIKRAQEAGVGAIINVGSNFNTSKKCVEMAISHSLLAIRQNQKANSQQLAVKLYSAVGIHPIHLAKDITETAIFDGKEYSFTTKKEDFSYNKFKKLVLSSKKVVAIGETGLDYYRLSDNSNSQFPISNSQSNSKSQISNVKKIQKEVFKEHIKLAKELGLPLILHCRGEEKDPFGAYDEMLKIFSDYCHPESFDCHSEPFACHTELSEASQDRLREESQDKLRGGSRDSSVLPQNDKVQGVIHCFGGNLRQAKKFIKLGFYIGFTGIVTFKNAINLQNTLKDCPLEKILIETDCPFLAPEPYRSKRNEPAYVIEVAKKIAELKKIPLAEVEKQTTDNATKLFGLNLKS